MGLLRGFKAKLRLKTKNNSTETNGVVCLRYQVNPDLYENPPPVVAVQEQNIGKREVVRHRRTITKPGVQNIFQEEKEAPSVPPKKSNLKKPKAAPTTIEEDNRVSPLIHMTSGHEENPEKIEHEYIEVVARNHVFSTKKPETEVYDDERHETETLSLKSGDENYASAAESLFFADVSPVAKSRPRNFRNITDYGDTLSQSSQTSA